MICPRGRRRFHPEYQRICSQLNFPGGPGERNKGNPHSQVGFYRRCRIRIDKHPLFANVARESLASSQDTLFQPLEIHKCADTVSRVLSLFQPVPSVPNNFRSRDSFVLHFPHCWIRFPGRAEGIPSRNRAQVAKLSGRETSKYRALRLPLWRLYGEKTTYARGVT
jgi:hypothetical protein